LIECYKGEIDDYGDQRMTRSPLLSHESSSIVSMVGSVFTALRHIGCLHACHVAAHSREKRLLVIGQTLAGGRDELVHLLVQQIELRRLFIQEQSVCQSAAE
jgi:hypothetical protein